MGSASSVEVIRGEGAPEDEIYQPTFTSDKRERRMTKSIADSFNNINENGEMEFSALHDHYMKIIRDNPSIEAQEHAIYGLIELIMRKTFTPPENKAIFAVLRDSLNSTSQVIVCHSLLGMSAMFEKNYVEKEQALEAFSIVNCFACDSNSIVKFYGKKCLKAYRVHYPDPIQLITEKNRRNE